VALLAAALALGVVGAIVAHVTSRDTRQSVEWALVVGGAVVVFLNVAGAASGPRADPTTGMMTRAFEPDSPPGAGWLLVGFALAGIGLAGLFG
jgi:hypothetical protein